MIYGKSNEIFFYKTIKNNYLFWILIFPRRLLFMINRLKTIEYHFVLNDSLKFKLLDISKSLKLKLSKTVILLLKI